MSRTVFPQDPPRNTSYNGCSLVEDVDEDEEDDDADETPEDEAREIASNVEGRHSDSTSFLIELKRKRGFNGVSASIVAITVD